MTLADKWRAHIPGSTSPSSSLRHVTPKLLLVLISDQRLASGKTIPNGCFLQQQKGSSRLLQPVSRPCSNYPPPCVFRARNLSFAKPSSVWFSANCLRPCSPAQDLTFAMPAMCLPAHCLTLLPASPQSIASLAGFPCWGRRSKAFWIANQCSMRRRCLPIDIFFVFMTPTFTSPICWCVAVLLREEEYRRIDITVYGILPTWH